jgi:hypothetical protein
MLSDGIAVGHPGAVITDDAGSRISADRTSGLRSCNGPGCQDAPAAPIQPDQKIRRAYILQDEPLVLGFVRFWAGTGRKSFT